MSAGWSAGYAMARDADEYQRLRRQADAWTEATVRMLDRAGTKPGGRCLDVGCGTGAVMELMAERVGPAGRVVGIDLDRELGARCPGEFVAADVETDDDAVPAGGFDLVYARLVLLHVKDPVAVLRRMWRWVAPGGTLVVQDYDLDAVTMIPSSDLVDEWRRVFIGAYAGAGRDYRIGLRLPALFAEAGIGEPDHTDVAGRLDRAADGLSMLGAVYRSVAPLALGQALITEAQRDKTLAAFDTVARERPEDRVLWPLLAGALKHR